MPEVESVMLIACPVVCACHSVGVVIYPQMHGLYATIRIVDQPQISPVKVTKGEIGGILRNMSGILRLWLFC